MTEIITYVGLDVHKETIVVALADGGERGDVRAFGQIVNTPAALSRLLTKLVQPGRALKFCYEAGPCGYGIQRQLSNAGHDCVVIAPSLMPKKPGDYINTDRSGEVASPRGIDRGLDTRPAHEAMRDLIRARLAAVRSLRQARQQLSGFLLRHGFHYSRSARTQMHRRWLAGLGFDQPIHNIVLEDHIATIESATERRDRLTKQIEATRGDWSLA